MSEILEAQVEQTELITDQELVTPRETQTL